MTFTFRFAGIFLVLLFYVAEFPQSCYGALNYLGEDGSQNIDFIVNFTKHLHKKHHFNGFVYFGESLDSDCAPNISTHALESALVKNFGLPIIVWGKERTTKLRKTISLNNLVFINIASIDDPILDVVDYTLEGLHYMPMLFIYKSVGNVPPNTKQLHDFFSWCWSKNIINVALTFETVASNQFYKYLPFPVITVFNLTNLIYTSDGDFIIEKISNTHGYQFKTPIISDPSWVILIPSKLHGQSESQYDISGTVGRLYKEFVQHINGTIKVMHEENMTFFTFYKYYVMKAAEKQIDIGIHPYYQTLNLANLTEGSYPIGWANVCIIVPVENGIKQSDYLSLAFMKSSRYLLMGMALSLALLQVLCNKPFYISLRRIGEALWNAFGMILLQALPLTQLQNRRSRFAFFFVMAIFLSLMLASIYTASLTALFSKIVLGKQIETVDDFLQSNLQILVHNFHNWTYFNTGLLPAALLHRLRVTDPEELAKHLDAIDTSYAYIVSSHMWMMLNMKQQRLSVPRFRIAGGELCTPQLFLGFPMQWDSPFMETLTQYIMYTQASGLPLKWEKETMRQIINLKLIDAIEDEIKHPAPINISHLEKALGFCVIMWIFSVLCFLGELTWHWWSVKRNRRSERRQQRRRRLHQIYVF